MGAIRTTAVWGVTLAMALAVACSTPAARLSDDAPEMAPAATRAALLRAELVRYEGKRLPGVDPAAFARARDWLAKMEAAGTSAADVELYEQAVRAQLELLRTTELRYGAGTEESR